MNDIKNIKDRVTSSRTVFVAEDGKGKGIIIATGEILSLITTIESQKETIDDQYMTISTANMWNSKLKDEIDSYKAITELAVKGLKHLISFPYISEFVDVDEIAKSTLSEIERLQNGSTS